MEFFHDRLGVSKLPHIVFDLHTLIHQVQLPILDGPFTKEEIDVVVKDMALDSAPGPNGFSGYFMKKY
jgi:hypothetical protein